MITVSIVLWGGLILLTVLISLGYLWDYRKRNPKTKPPADKKPSEVKKTTSHSQKPSKAFQIFKIWIWHFVEGAIALGLLLFFFPKTRVLLIEPMFWLDLVLVSFLFWRHQVGKTFLTEVAVIILLASNLIYFFPDQLKRFAESRNGTKLEEKTTPPTVVKPAQNWDKKTDFLARKILFEGLPIEQASELYFVIGEESSGYNQYDQDDHVIQNGTATCVAQIKTDVWGEKANELGYDLSKAEDCLRMAVWIRKNDPRGILNWEESLPKITGYYAWKVSAPAGDWSPKLQMKENCVLATNNSVVRLKDETGAEHKIVPGEYPEVQTKDFWVRSDKEDEYATLILLCR